ncbi:MAG: hypothetical protein KW806_02685 [Candidatus Yanofskybacteria bacterium]|nr:hypothetical protein [Candidatus Yanofskybacteria bacterium]
MKYGLTSPEERIFKSLNTPVKIQNFLDALPMNFEEYGDTLKSPRFVLQDKTAHCLEGALLAAAVLWYHGQEPLLLDIQSTREDWDHVVTLFNHRGRWGAISKTNHAVLRYREPVYRTYHELAMSFFHEYFLPENGKKTMRAYSKPFNLKKLGTSWITAPSNLWSLSGKLDSSPHIKVTTPRLTRFFRKADPIELKAMKIVEWKE